MQQSYYCNVYRDASGGDCTNGGASSRFKRATLWRGRVPKGSTSDSIAIFDLVETNVSGEPYPKAGPAGETRWTMFGGRTGMSRGYIRRLRRRGPTLVVISTGRLGAV